MWIKNNIKWNTYNSLNTNVKNNIKSVNKEYIKTYDDANSKITCLDKLWLLSCGEIWDNGTNGEISRGKAMAIEGSQYKYYKLNLGSTWYSSATNITKKPENDSTFWWLRSPYRNISNFFCNVDLNGYCIDGYANANAGVALGFSI